MEEQASNAQEKVVKLQRGKKVPLRDYVGRETKAEASSTARPRLIPLTKQQASEAQDGRDLRSYQAQQKERDRKQGLKQKGQTDLGNLVNDMGTSALTEVTQFRFPNEEELEAGRSGDWGRRLDLITNAANHGMVNEMTGGLMNYGAGKFISGEAQALGKKILAEPGIVSRSVKQATSPYRRAFTDTWKRTADLPLVKRTTNALNSATLQKGMLGDVSSHSYFSMTPAEAQKKMSRELIDLPRGAASYDPNMSMNSSPLMWTQAERAARNASKLPSKDAFTIIRTGGSQQVNDSGYMGRDIFDALPQSAKDAQGAMMRNFQSDVQLIKADIKAGNIGSKVGNDIINDTRNSINAQLKYNLDPIQNAEFHENMIPAMDKGIRGVNQATGLKFPGTNIMQTHHGEMALEQPSIVSVKDIATRRKAVVGDVVDRLGAHYKINKAIHADKARGLDGGQLHYLNFDIQNYGVQESGGGGVPLPRRIASTQRSNAELRLRPWEVEHDAGIIASLQRQGIETERPPAIVRNLVNDINWDWNVGRAGLNRLEVTRPGSNQAGQLPPPPPEINF